MSAIRSFVRVKAFKTSTDVGRNMNGLRLSLNRLGRSTTSIGKSFESSLTLLEFQKSFIQETSQKDRVYEQAKDREKKWLEIESEFGNQIINYDNQQNNLANRWQNINHIFETPFYFIEYAIAQLGAIAIWKSYKETGEKALENYINALKLGYTKSIPEIYETAGIKFDFSASYVKELADFIKEELEKLN